MTESELEYLRRRTAEELDLADRSPVVVAADVHRRLAALYAGRIAEMRDVPHLELVEADTSEPGLIEPEIVEPMIMSQLAVGPR